MDPYLEKRKREEAEIAKQIQKQLLGKAPEIGAGPEVPPVDMSDFLYQTPGGIFIPAVPMGEKNYGPSILDAATKGWATSTNSVYKTDAKSIMAAVKAAKEKMDELTTIPAPPSFYGYPVVYGTKQDIYDALLNGVFGPVVGQGYPERRKEQKILSGYHGRRFEYVYSETLKCHVRIGESLKEKTDADSV